MELAVIKFGRYKWRSQLHWPSVAFVCECFFGNPSPFSFRESLLFHVVYMRIVTPDWSGWAGSLGNPMSFNSGSFVGTTKKMENMEWLAIRF